MRLLHRKPDAVQTVQRIFGAFPAEQQNNIIYQPSNSLQAIVAQNLLPRADGVGQVLACEICIATPAIRKLIRDGESHLIGNEIQTGRKFGMQSMDMALLDLYQRGEITYDVAMSCCRDVNQFRKKTA